jgi:pyruvate formate lyase activating enzyme
VPSVATELPIKGILETSFIDWKGCLSSVVFTGGCNFRCPYCHNRDLVTESGEETGNVPLAYIRAFFEKYRDWIDRLVVTGGEPTIHAALPAFLEEAKGQGLAIKLDTNGSSPSVLRKLVARGLVDYVAMDVKGPLGNYDRWCGTGVNVTKVQQSIDFLLEGNVDYEFRMTVVPFLHRDPDIYETAEYLKSAKRFFIQEFRPQNTLDPTFAHIRPFSPGKIDQIRANVTEILSGRYDRPVVAK